MTTLPSTSIRTLARQLMAEDAAAKAEYLAERERSYREGFRPQYCFHGANLWSDYDVICGWCELGEQDPDRPMTFVDALYRALRVYRKDETRDRTLGHLRRAFNLNAAGMLDEGKESLDMAFKSGDYETISEAHLKGLDWIRVERMAFLGKWL